MNIKRVIALSAVLGIAGCTADVPYRSLGFDPTVGAAQCERVYAQYDAAKAEGPYPEIDRESDCWKRSREEHRDYDMMFVEFDDQGWVQGAWRLDPEKDEKDFMDQFMEQLEQLHKRQHRDGGLSLVVYVHGWHHSARAWDDDVHAFRRVLGQFAQMENNLAGGSNPPKRVVGIFIGWRGEAMPIWGLRGITFWDRKNTAQRVANGSVRDLLGRIDNWRDSKPSTRKPSPNKQPVPNVRMLTIGHSFGGLIAFESLSSDFVRSSVRYRKGAFAHGISRVGDLVVIVNPAFEGIKYEPLRVASVRLQGLDTTQLPALIVATSEGDWATKHAFRFARYFSTALEIENGEQRKANIRAVGHNERFTTHRLEKKKCDADADCSKACTTQAAKPTDKVRGEVAEDKIQAEYRLMHRIRDDGVAPIEYLCNELKLSATKAWKPERNPFWVVQTSRDVIADHGDIFNPNFVAFLRQMYLGFIFAVYDEGPR